MEFMVLRRANQSTERGQQPPALEPGTFLKPSNEAVRLLRRDGVWRMAHGPFAPRELVAGLTLIEAASKTDAIEQVRWWPLFDSGAVYEIRDAGSPGHWPSFDLRGTVQGTLPRRDPALTRYVIFIASDANAEANGVPPPELVDRITAFHEEGVQQGLLLEGAVFRSSASATRVHFANFLTTVVDGPFPASRELCSGYVMLQATSRQAAIELAQQLPYGGDGDVMLELREACERIAHQEFTPEMRAAEERLRAELLEVSLREAFKKKARSV